MKTNSPDPVIVGGTLTYTVTVSNVSNVDAVNVIVTDTMPAHVTPISATPSQGSCTGVVCNLGTIKAGKKAIIEYVVTVDDDAPALLTNQACVGTDTPETNLANNCGQAVTHVPRLGVSSTPVKLPPTGGLPGTGTPDDRLMLGLGVGLLIAGAFAATVARRRQDSSG